FRETQWVARRADCKHCERWSVLRQGDVHALRPGAVLEFLMHMRDDPDDLRGLLVHASDQEPLPDGIHTRGIRRPKTASQGFVYDGDALRIRGVTLGEIPTAPQRNLERAKVSGR